MLFAWRSPAVVLAALATLLGTAPVRAQSDPAALYHNYCSVCHGDKGDGRSRAAVALVPPPRDFTSEASRRELSEARILLAIRHGRPGTAMVSWTRQLSDADMRALAAYVYGQFVHRERLGDPRGRALYVRNCAVCHGDRGEGAVWAGANMARPPRNFTAPDAQGLSREAMIAAVTHGRAGTAMTGFASHLTAQEIALVVDYVRTAIMAPAISGTRAHGGREADAAAPGVAADMAAPFPAGLRGDARRGALFFNANCATCHGVHGDGAGPRAYFINPKPKSFVDQAARGRFNRPFLFGAISDGRVGTEMPAWRQVIDEQQIADVAEYVLRTFVTAAPAAAPRQ